MAYNVYQATYVGRDGLRKKANTWTSRVSIGGKTYRKATGTTDRRAAMRIARKRHQELLKQGADFDPVERGSTISVLAAVNEYVDHLEARGKTERHIRLVRDRILALFPRPSQKHLASVRAGEIETALDRIARTPTQRRGGEDEKPSPQTVDRYRVAVRALLGWAVRREYVPSNAADKVERWAGPKTFNRRALTAAQARALLDSVPVDRKAAYGLALWCGLRRSEAAGLLWIDLDLEARTVRLRPKGTKAKKAAILPLPVDAVGFLREYRALDPHRDRVLPAVPLNRTLRADLEAVGVEPVNAQGRIDYHALRATFGTLMARAGVPLQLAQRLMRHSTPVLTANVYSLVESDDLADAIATMPELCPVEVDEEALGGSPDVAAASAEADYSGVRAENLSFTKPLHYHCATPARG